MGNSDAPDSSHSKGTRFSLREPTSFAYVRNPHGSYMSSREADASGARKNLSNLFPIAKITSVFARLTNGPTFSMRLVSKPMTSVRSCRY